MAVVTEDEICRQGVVILKRMAYVRQPPYELPGDSFLELAVRAIVRLAREAADGDGTGKAGRCERSSG